MQCCVSRGHGTGVHREQRRALWHDVIQSTVKRREPGQREAVVQRVHNLLTHLLQTMRRAPLHTVRTCPPAHESHKLSNIPGWPRRMA